MDVVVYTLHELQKNMFFEQIVNSLLCKEMYNYLIAFGD